MGCGASFHMRSGFFYFWSRARPETTTLLSGLFHALPGPNAPGPLGSTPSIQDGPLADRCYAGFRQWCFSEASFLADIICSY
jgi:hypothetical protein